MRVWLPLLLLAGLLHISLAVSPPKFPGLIRGGKANARKGKGGRAPKGKTDLDDDSDDAVVEVSAPEDEGASRSAATMQLVLSAASLLGQQLVTRLNFSDKRVMRLCRLVFFLYLALSHLMLGFIRRKILEADDSSPVPEAESGHDLLQTLGQQLPGVSLLRGLVPQPDAKAGDRLTVREYDLSEVSRLGLGLAAEAAVTLYMDLVARMPYLTLLVPLTGVVSKLKAPIVQVHLFGRRAVGELRRPFRSALGRAAQSEETRSRTAVEEVEVDLKDDDEASGYDDTDEESDGNEDESRADDEDIEEVEVAEDEDNVDYGDESRADDEDIEEVEVAEDEDDSSPTVVRG